MKPASIQARLGIEGFENIRLMQFKRGPMRRAFRTAGREVARSAKQKISKSGGAYPGKRTGRMSRSLSVKIGSKGLYAKVRHLMPEPPSKWKKDPRDQGFYPAFLHYGTSRGLRSRGNWIADALRDRETDIRMRLRAALTEALK